MSVPIAISYTPPTSPVPTIPERFKPPVPPAMNLGSSCEGNSQLQGLSARLKSAEINLSNMNLMQQIQSVGVAAGLVVANPSALAAYVASNPLIASLVGSITGSVTSVISNALSALNMPEQIALQTETMAQLEVPAWGGALDLGIGTSVAMNNLAIPKTQCFKIG